MKIKLITFLCLTSIILKAQQASIQFFRSNDKTGIAIFETTKADTIPFTGIKVRVGGNFAQDFQSLNHQNKAIFVASTGAPTVNTNELIKLTPGFNLAMANLNIDVQLADGVRLNLTNYLSTRHHQETWVKSGYIQFDKLPFLKNNLVDSIMKQFTIKVGDLEVNYGDQHFRRSDAGNTIHNPFVENYIMDGFTTEIGGELYYHSKSGVIAMGGIFNGQLNPTVIASTKIDSATGKLNRYEPAFLGKLGYDKQLNKNLRLRITGSVYSIKSSSRSTLFFGDRAGSHYFLVGENTAATTTANAWSGRYNPMFSQQINTFIINPFIKYKSLEFFGTYEISKGRTITEKVLRKNIQYAADLIFRFPAGRENFWLALRYNVLSAELSLVPSDITISRIVGSAGWFVTKNIMLKVEYVDQQYKNFQESDIRSGAKYNGFVIEAVVAF